MHRVAFYDLDRTVTRLPTWTPFLIAGARWRLLLAPAAALAAAAHGVGLIDRVRLKQVMHRLLLGRALAPTALARRVEAFADRTDAGNIRSGARAQIAADRAAGYRIVLATAAHRFYAVAIARRLGIDDVVATRACTDARGRILSRIDGENCYGPAKLAMIQAWLRDHGIERGGAHVRCYSDHISDRPTLEWADEAVAVHPDSKLRALAGMRRWRIADWQSPPMAIRDEA